MTVQDLHAAEITLVVMTVVAGLFSGAMLWLIKEPRTPRWMDFLTSILLLLFSAMLLGILTDVLTLFSDGNVPAAPSPA